MDKELYIRDHRAVGTKSCMGTHSRADGKELCIELWEQRAVWEPIIEPMDRELYMSDHRAVGTKSCMGHIVEPMDRELYMSNHRAAGKKSCMGTHSRADGQRTVHEGP